MRMRGMAAIYSTIFFVLLSILSSISFAVILYNIANNMKQEIAIATSKKPGIINTASLLAITDTIIGKRIDTVNKKINATPNLLFLLSVLLTGLLSFIAF